MIFKLAISKISYNLSCINRSIKTVVVIGSGLMGSGIAQVSAQSGYDVKLIDVDEKLLKKATEKIEKNLLRVAKKKYPEEKHQVDFIKTSMDRIKVSISAVEAAKQSDLIIEAIMENMDMKHKLFKQLDDVAPSNCLFASNTSSLSITEIAKVTKRLDRFGGLHFFNPVPVMQLVEIVSTNQTSADTTKALTEFSSRLGKTSVQCRDTPGFVVNRLLVPYLAEALRMLERGDAAAADIDAAMKLGAGHPMGPLTLADYVGLDTTQFILAGWHARFPTDPLFKPIPLLEKLVAQGKLGQKSGAGIFDYGTGK